MYQQLQPNHNTHVLAHMNPKEIGVLSNMQGNVERDHNGVPVFHDNLVHAFKNPEMIPHMQDAIRQAHAQGGSVHNYHNDPVQTLADNGIHGDTALAWLPNNLSRLFDEAIGHPGGSRNPHDGHKQYFDMTGILSGLGKLGSSAMSGMGTMAQAASPYLQQAMKSPMMQQLASQGMGMLANKIGQGNPNSAIGRFAQQAAGHLTSNMADTIGQHGFDPNQMMQSAQGSFGNVMNQGMNQGMNYMNRQSGMPEMPQQPSLLTNKYQDMPQDPRTMQQRFSDFGSQYGGELAGRAAGAFNKFASPYMGEQYGQFGNALENFARNQGSRYGAQLGERAGGGADQVMQQMGISNRLGANGAGRGPAYTMPQLGANGAGRGPAYTMPQQAQNAGGNFGARSMVNRPVPSQSMNRFKQPMQNSYAPQQFGGYEDQGYAEGGVVAPHQNNGHPTLGYMANQLMNQQEARHGSYGYGN
jgi:hypothetical protein